MASNPKEQVASNKRDDRSQKAQLKTTIYPDRSSPELAIVAPKLKRRASRAEKLSATAKGYRELLCQDGLLRLHPDASEFLGISRSVIFQLVRDGQLPYVRVTRGGDRRIPRQALVEFAAIRLVERAP